MPIKVRYNGLEVDGNLLPLVSGAVHYWRLDPEKWSFILDQVKSLGFNIVETFVPWSVHEISPGEYDFGRVDAAKNLDRFLSLCEEKGLKALLRLGPHVNAGLSDFGYPSRIIHGEQYWSRDSFGAPCISAQASSQFAVPSYASEELINEFEPFLAALAPLLQKHLYPNGGVMAIQVGNDAGFFGRPGNYDNDYSLPSLKLYRHFLELKYRQLKQINEAYQSKHKSFDDVEAPRKPELDSKAGLRRGLDWSEYKEYQLLWFLSKMAELFKSKGLGAVPFFHSFSGSPSTPFNVTDLEKDSGIEFCGIESFGDATNTQHSVDQARYLSAQSLLPYVPEFGSGSWPFETVAPDQHDAESRLLAPIMGGARALNFYMLVERERWLGSPISADGDERPEMAQLLRRFNKFLTEQEWSKSSPQNVAVLLQSREFQQVQAASTRPAQMADRGFFPAELWRQPLKKELIGASTELADVGTFYEAGQTWLKDNSFSYALGDSSIPTDKIKKYSFAIAASWAYSDENYTKRLRSFVEAGGFLVIGPELPSLNSRFGAMEAWSDLKIEEGKALSIGDGKLLYLREFDPKQVSSFIRKGKVIPELTLSDNSLDLALHKASGRSVLFVRNPHSEERPCTVVREGKFVLKPLWSSGKFLGAVEEREVRLAPHEIKVWEVIPC